MTSSQVTGKATASGTKRFADRFADSFESDFYRKTQSRLVISSIGMGTYLGECDDREDERYTKALAAGITRGLNVIDTAINYRCQRSERAVGRALRNLIDSGAVERNEIVVCTKAGYVPLEGEPPESRDQYDAYLDREYFASSVMSRDDLVAGGHCIRPRFIVDQIKRSQSNMGIDCIDVFYLHNPEQQLDSVTRQTFHSLITDAFSELESQVSAGRISSYGCATWNGFRVVGAAKNHLSLEELVDIAEKVGGRSHHFRFIQLPINHAMTEAVRGLTQPMKYENVGLLDVARKLGVSVVASASLMQGQLTRSLPDGVRSLFPDLTTDAQRAIAFVRSLPVASALVGTRSISHLEENIAAGSAVIRA
jgi:aryl-alcohol dehydrogenase-like predicted oxidoreductase